MLAIGFPSGFEDTVTAGIAGTKRRAGPRPCHNRQKNGIGAHKGIASAADPG